MTQLFPFLLAIVLDGATEEHLDDDDDDNTLHAAGRMVVAGTKAAVSGGGYEGTFFLFQTTFLFVCNTLNMPGVGKTLMEGTFAASPETRARREREREKERRNALDRSDERKRRKERKNAPQTVTRAQRFYRERRRRRESFPPPQNLRAFDLETTPKRPRKDHAVKSDRERTARERERRARKDTAERQ